ncbi:MAG: FIST C-terminal domain-containing protein [Candidatus Omnitrophica bacterium]|nr:FIST C-terminal domain-containing protein [Candidatus Omnitrophota bacterium]
MATRIGTGFSSLSDPVEAFKAAAIEAKTVLNTIQTDVVFAFTTAGYITPPGIAALQRILQPERLIGSTTTGIIVNDRVETRGVGLLAIVSDELHFGGASLEKINLLTAREAGYGFAKALLNNHKSNQRNACLYFYDGVRYNGSAFHSGIHDGLGLALPIAGGVGIDSPKTLKTQFFYQTHILENAATGLLVGGAGIAAVTSRHSWQPLGKPRIIDSVQGNIIKTIDKKPAMDLYKDYFQDAGLEITNTLDDIRLLYPLGIGTNKPREYLIRNAIDILDDGSIVCQGDVPTESKVHLMITNKDACHQSTSEAAHELREKMMGKIPKVIFIFESLIRRKVMGRSATQNLQVIREMFGHHVPIFGMYTIGETASLRTPASSAATQLSNGSITLLAIG